MTLTKGILPTTCEFIRGMAAMRRAIKLVRRVRDRLFPYIFHPPKSGPLVPRLEFRTTEPVREALARLGRTEDVRFSPDGTRLAIAGFARGRCLLLRIKIDELLDDLVVSADDYLEITSMGIGRVHGLDFIDDQTLVVANRNGLVCVFELPEGDLSGREVRLEPLSQVRGKRFTRIESPGSVAVLRGQNGELSLMVCNNYVDRVTRHVLDPRNYEELQSQVSLTRGLEIPDGISISPDGKWIAVSSHGTHDVKVFSATRRMGRGVKAAGELRNVNYPHGLRFTGDGRKLLVADAGSPFIHVYETGAGWNGKRSPVHSATVLDEATFLRGRRNPEEGGPKGIDIDRSDRVVAMTCEEVPLVFFSLRSITGEAGTAREHAEPELASAS